VKKTLLRHAGVSLIELLVVMVILSIVSAALFTIFAAGTQSFSYGTKTANLQTGLAGALNVVLDDLSVAGYLRTGPTFAFTSVTLAAGTTSASVTFEGDVNSDGFVDQVTYDVASGVLRRTMDLGTASGTFTSGGAPSTTPLMANLTSTSPDPAGFQLTFLDATRTVITSNLQNARYAQVTLTVRDTTVKSATSLARSLVGETTLRNFTS
jgi:prepilin-type N-terminal cleavage/methylation domain-containing protein